MVPEDLWEYFNPNEEVVYEKPSPLMFEDVRPGATALTNLTAIEKSWLYSPYCPSCKTFCGRFEDYKAHYLNCRAWGRGEIWRTAL